MKIISILTSKSDINNNYVDAWLIPVKNFSCRSFFEVELETIKEIKKETNKEVYLLCDKLIPQNELNLLKENFFEIINLGDLVFFQDLAIFNLAKNNNSLDKLVYYSPTLCVSYQDIEIYKKLGLKHFILSKENTYGDYKAILNHHNDIHLGMLSYGYPQIYYSKRKMISSFKKQYNLVFNDNNLKIKEKTRDFYQPIFEDKNGTYIFAGKVFFPYRQLKEFCSLGMEYFIVDNSFIGVNNAEYLVNLALNGQLEKQENVSTYLMFENMVNDYGK